jgi:hypothetical protein
MQKQGWLLMAAAALLGGGLVLGPSGALAQECANLAASQCSSSCGTAGVASCTKSGPDVSCVCNETTKDVKGNAFGTATGSSSTGQGNLGNKTEEGPCTGNQGQCKQQ